MDIEKKYLFLPYNIEDYGLIKELLHRKINIDIATFEGVGLAGKDISYVCNRKPLCKHIYSFNYIKHNEYDYVIISNSVDKLKSKEIYFKFKKWLSSLKARILYFGDDSELRRLFSSEVSHSNIVKEMKSFINVEPQLASSLDMISTPIVYVGGLIEMVDTFDISVQLRRMMEDIGYKVSLVTTNLYSKLISAHSYPKEFMNKMYEVDEQILKLNQYVSGIEKVDSPDLIILHIPKGMMRYSTHCHNSFGIYTSMISKVLPPDYLIISLPNNVTSTISIDKMNTYFKKELSKSIDAINVSNAYIDINTKSIPSINNPLYLEEEKINKVIKECGNQPMLLLNMNENKSIRILSHNIIQKLSG